MLPISKATNRHDVVRQVIEFIEDNYAQAISLADVAQTFSYSRSHLTTLVRKETGLSITARIIERRLLAARERLLATDDSVAEIAEAVGFRDVAYFTRRFARSNGTTPCQWRSRCSSHEARVPRRAALGEKHVTGIESRSAHVASEGSGIRV